MNFVIYLLYTLYLATLVRPSLPSLPALQNGTTPSYNDLQSASSDTESQSTILMNTTTNSPVTDPDSFIPSSTDFETSESIPALPITKPLGPVTPPIATFETEAETTTVASTTTTTTSAVINTTITASDATTTDTTISTTIATPDPPESALTTKRPRKPRRPQAKNYARAECAEVVASNTNAWYVERMLNRDPDEYMLTACDEPIWFVIELCASVQPHYIEVGNLELYSSSPKDFSIYVSNDFPNNNDWQLIGKFSADDAKTLQIFEVEKMGYAKFLKYEMHSHYRDEYYCPISFVRVYGESILDDPPSRQKGSKDDNEPDDIIEAPREGAGSLYNAAKNAVAGFIDKILPSPNNQTSKSKQEDASAGDSSRDLIKRVPKQNLCNKYRHKTPALAGYYIIMSSFDRYCSLNETISKLNRNPKTTKVPFQTDKSLPTTASAQQTHFPNQSVNNNDSRRGALTLDQSVYTKINNSVQALESSLLDYFQNKLNETNSEVLRLKEELSEKYVFCILITVVSLLSICCVILMYLWYTARKQSFQSKIQLYAQQLESQLQIQPQQQLSQKPYLQPQPEIQLKVESQQKQELQLNSE